MVGLPPLYEGGAVARFGPFSPVGRSAASGPPLLSAGKITNWDTRLEVLGWIVDTESLADTLPSPKRLKLRVLLSEWPPSRASASAKLMSPLVGFLMHIWGLSLRNVCWPWLRCRAPQPTPIARAGRRTPVGVSPSDPSPTVTSSSGASLSARGWTCRGRLCRLRYITFSRVSPSVLCFRTLRNPLSGASDSNLVSTGDTTLAPRNGLVSAAGVGLSPAWTTFQSTFSSF